MRKCLELRFTGNPYPAKVIIIKIYLNFQPLEVVSREPQLQVGENYAFVLNLNTNIWKS